MGGSGTEEVWFDVAISQTKQEKKKKRAAMGSCAFVLWERNRTGAQEPTVRILYLQER